MSSHVHWVRPFESGGQFSFASDFTTPSHALSGSSHCISILMSRRMNAVGTLMSSWVIPTLQPSSLSVQGTIGTSAPESGGGISYDAENQQGRTKKAHEHGQYRQDPHHHGIPSTICAIQPAAPMTPWIRNITVIAGIMYIRTTSLFLDRSLFLWILAHSSLEQIAGSSSSGTGVQHTTQCRCGSTPIFALFFPLREDAAARASLAVRFAALNMVSLRLIFIPLQSFLRTLHPREIS